MGLEGQFKFNVGNSSVLVPRIGKHHVATFRKRLESLGNFFFFFCQYFDNCSSFEYKLRDLLQLETREKMMSADDKSKLISSFESKPFFGGGFM